MTTAALRLMGTLGVVQVCSHLPRSEPENEQRGAWTPEGYLICIKDFMWASHWCPEKSKHQQSRQDTSQNYCTFKSAYILSRGQQGATLLAVKTYLSAENDLMTLIKIFLNSLWSKSFSVYTKAIKWIFSWHAVGENSPLCEHCSVSQSELPPGLVRIPYFKISNLTEKQ